MIPGIVSSYSVVDFAVGVAGDEIRRGGSGGGARRCGDDDGLGFFLLFEGDAFRILQLEKECCDV